MIDKQKIEWLGNEFVSLPKFRRKNNMEANKNSLRFIQQECERMKSMLSEKRSSDERYEIYKILNRSIRRAQDICKDIYNVHYIEDFENDKRRVKEHVIPQNLLTDAYVEGHITFTLMLGMPLVDLSEASDQLLAGKGLAKLNSNWLHPFRRYKIAGIEQNIKTPGGVTINFDTFTLEDHFKMYKELQI